MGVWSYDFVEAQTHDGRKLRLMTLIDEFTRSPPFGASANLTIPCHKDPAGRDSIECLDGMAPADETHDSAQRRFVS
jgi:hypothetical protein